MSIFHKAIRDIWACRDFIETAIIGGVIYDVVCSKIANDGIAFMDTGAESPANFTLDLMLPCAQMPKINDQVIFREKHYKVDDIEIDSANASIKLHLIDLSRGVK